MLLSLLRFPWSGFHVLRPHSKTSFSMSEVPRQRRLSKNPMRVAIVDTSWVSSGTDAGRDTLC